MPGNDQPLHAALILVPFLRSRSQGDHPPLLPSWLITPDPFAMLSVNRVTSQVHVLIPMEGCLRKGHVSRDCRSMGCCNKCRERHHNTICPRKNESTSNPSVMLPGPVTEGQEGASQASGGAHRPTNVAHVDSQTPILLQTARQHNSPTQLCRGQSCHG